MSSSLNSPKSFHVNHALSLETSGSNPGQVFLKTLKIALVVASPRKNLYHRFIAGDAGFLYTYSQIIVIATGLESEVLTNLGVTVTNNQGGQAGAVNEILPYSLSYVRLAQPAFLNQIQKSMNRRQYM